MNPVEAVRDAWRELSRIYDADLRILEVTCSDEQLHKKRIETGIRGIAGMPEVTWERVLARKREYEPWHNDHLTLDSVEPTDMLVGKALVYIR